MIHKEQQSLNGLALIILQICGNVIVLNAKYHSLRRIKRVWGEVAGVKLQKERSRRPRLFKKMEIVLSQVIANTCKVLSDKVSVCVEKTRHAQHKSSEMCASKMHHLICSLPAGKRTLEVKLLKTPANLNV